MSFFNFITGGTPKVMAKQIADLHNITNGNYLFVFESTLNDIINNHRNYNHDFIFLFKENLLKNYTDLIAIKLNALAAPKGISYRETRESLETAIQKHLRNFRLPEEYITGNNYELSAPLSKELNNVPE